MLYIYSFVLVIFILIGFLRRIAVAVPFTVKFPYSGLNTYVHFIHISQIRHNIIL